MAKYAREPINGFTHLFGAILSFLLFVLNYVANVTLFF